TQGQTAVEKVLQDFGATSLEKTLQDTDARRSLGASNRLGQAAKDRYVRWPVREQSTPRPRALETAKHDEEAD
ncbi:hypothetical protein ACPCKL_33535, partial [Streptomyces cellulosae]